MFRFNQELLKPPDLLCRHPDTTPDPAHLEITFTTKAVSSLRRDREIDGNLIHAEEALQGGLSRQPVNYQKISVTQTRSPRILTTIIDVLLIKHRDADR